MLSLFVEFCNTYFKEEVSIIQILDLSKLEVVSSSWLVLKKHFMIPNISRNQRALSGLQQL